MFVLALLPGAVRRRLPLDKNLSWMSRKRTRKRTQAGVPVRGRRERSQRPGSATDSSFFARPCRSFAASCHSRRPGGPPQTPRRPRECPRCPNSGDPSGSGPVGYLVISFMGLPCSPWPTVLGTPPGGRRSGKLITEVVFHRRLGIRGGLEDPALTVLDDCLPRLRELEPAPGGVERVQQPNA